MFQVTTPAASVPPPVADTKLVFAGTVSLITTPVAIGIPCSNTQGVGDVVPATTGQVRPSSRSSSTGTSSPSS